MHNQEPDPIEPETKAPHNEAPINPIPPAVAILFLCIVGVELVMYLGETGLVGGQNAIGWRNALAQQFGFSGRGIDWMMANQTWPPEHLIRFVTYPFIHAGFTHGLIGGVMVLAVGKITAESIGAWRVLAVFFASVIFGALGWGLLLDDPRLLVGAFPGAYGLVGAFTYLLFLRLDQKGQPRRKAFMLIGILLAVQFLFLVLSGFKSTQWLPDMIGFVVGFSLTMLFVPGGWGRFLQAARRR